MWYREPESRQQCRVGRIRSISPVIHVTMKWLGYTASLVKQYVDIFGVKGKIATCLGMALQGI